MSQIPAASSAREEGHKSSRRSFLKQAAAVGAAAVGAPAVGGQPAQQAMPMIRLGPHRVSRLILGSNPMAGFSHVSRLMSRHMTEWYTTERIGQVVKRCLEAGINTWQSNSQESMLKALRQFREGGGEVQWICLADSDAIRSPEKLKTIIDHKPIAVVHHGGVSDSLWRQGKIDSARDFIRRVRDHGVLGGLSAHNPDVIRHAADSGWQLDLFMTCFYQVTRTHEQLKKLLGHVPLGEIYLPEDPAAMCRVVRHVKVPCLGFKILAAGRRCERPDHVRDAFQFAFSSIKPTDGVIVGMYPRYSDQVSENAALTRQYGRLGAG